MNYKITPKKYYDNGCRVYYVSTYDCGCLHKIMYKYIGDKEESHPSNSSTINNLLRINSIYKDVVQLELDLYAKDLGWIEFVE